MLNIIDVHKTFNKGTVNEKKALDGIDLHLNPGDFVTVIGGNGAGKSTMLNMIAGVYPIDQGTILLDGKDISDLPEHKRAYMLGRVFQDPMMGIGTRGPSYFKGRTIVRRTETGTDTAHGYAE